jgi:hypothetical protein
MTTEVKPLAEITHEALTLLCKHLGIADTIRFVNQFTTGYGNYTEERKEMFGAVTLEKIIAEIEQTRSTPTVPDTRDRAEG